MNIFLTGSPNTDIACQVNFGFFTKYKIFIRAAKFRQKFVASENSLCTLFVSDPHQQLHGRAIRKAIFKQHVSCAMPFIVFLIINV